jgi:hypothetical protein
MVTARAAPGNQQLRRALAGADLLDHAHGHPGQPQTQHGARQAHFVLLRDKKHIDE